MYTKQHHNLFYRPQEDHKDVVEVIHLCREILIKAIFTQANYRLNSANDQAQQLVTQYRERLISTVAPKNIQKAVLLSKGDPNGDPVATMPAEAAINEDERMQEVANKMGEVMPSE